MGQQEEVIRRIAELLAEICRPAGLAVISTAELEQLEARAHPDNTFETLPPPSRVLVTVQQLCQRTPAFKEQTIRQLLFARQQNGLDRVVRYLGRRLLIDEEQFFMWIDERSGIMSLETSRSSGSRPPRYAGPTNGRTA